MKKGIKEWLETQDLRNLKRDPGDYTPKTGWEDEDSKHHLWLKAMDNAHERIMANQKVQ